MPTATWIALYARLIVLGPLRLLACLCGALLMRAACFVSQRIPATRAYVLAPAAMAIARGMLLALGFLRIQHTSWRSAPHSRHSAAGTAPRSRHSAGGSSNGSAGSAVAAAAEQLQDELRSRDETPIVVCNHVSWLDILLVQCFYAAAFVARVEQRSVPIIGGICDALPCVYVDREKGSNSAPSPSSASSSVASGAKSTTDKVVDRINAKYADKDAPLRPLVIFAEVRSPGSRRSHIECSPSRRNMLCAMHASAPGLRCMLGGALCMPPPHSGASSRTCVCFACSLAACRL